MEDTTQEKIDETIEEEVSEETTEVVAETEPEVVEAPTNLQPNGAPKPKTEPAVVQDKEKGTVVLSQEAFDAFIADFNKAKQDLKSVLAIQTKNDLNKIEEMRNAGKLVKSVKVRKISGKHVVGWKTLEDEVFMDSASGRLVERQTVRAFFEDGSNEQYSMRQWGTAPEYIPFEVVKESKDADGYLFFTVRNEEGKEFEINSIYVN